MRQGCFETDNLGLAAYVALNGLSFRSAELTGGKKQVTIIFDDEEGRGPELERNFVGSREKMYRDLIFLFRNKIDEALRDG